MGAHVFVVDRFSFPVHRSRGFCGVKNPYNIKSRLSLYADLLCVRKGDLIFFYQRRIDEPRTERGFRGIYKTISEPFFDKEDLEWEGNVVLGKCPHCEESYSEKAVDDAEQYCPNCKSKLDPTKHILPNRVLIRPLEYYEKPVDDNTAYIDHTNHGMLWTMLFRKIYGPGRERSVAPLLPEEAEKLSRLLRRVNEGKSTSLSLNPYSATGSPIEVELGKGPRVRYENALMAWVMKNIDRQYPVLKDVVGPIDELEYFGNNVLYGIGGEKVDVLLLHKKKVRYKATVMELKKDSIEGGAIKQITDYSYWIAQLSTANVLPAPPESLDLQPVVIGYDIASDVPPLIERVKQTKLNIPYERVCQVTIYKPILMTYNVTDNQIEFQIHERLSKGSLLDYL